MMASAMFRWPTCTSASMSASSQLPPTSTNRWWRSPFFKGVEQAFVDFTLVEFVNFAGGEQADIVHQAVAVDLVEAMGGLQASGKFARLAFAVSPN
jgi:hypothetical protein